MSLSDFGCRWFVSPLVLLLLLASTDAAETWRQTSDFAAEELWVSGQHAVAWDDWSWVASHDGGATWSEPLALPDLRVRQARVVGAAVRVLYADGSLRDAGGSVLRQGVTRIAVDGAGHLYWSDARTVYTDGAQVGGIILAAGPDGVIYRSAGQVGVLRPQGSIQFNMKAREQDLPARHEVLAMTGALTGWGFYDTAGRFWQDDNGFQTYTRLDDSVQLLCQMDLRGRRGLLFRMRGQPPLLQHEDRGGDRLADPWRRMTADHPADIRRVAAVGRDDFLALSGEGIWRFFAHR